MGLRGLLMRMFLVFSVMILCFIVSCGSTSLIQNGTLKQPIVMINPDKGVKFGGGEASKLRDIKTNLAFELWDSFEYKKIASNQSAWQEGKEEYCVISGKGVELSIGEKVEVIDEARCLKSQFSAGDGTPSRRFPVGLVKIRIISTGQEGWTWTKSVEFE